jgi:hypothetical protein
MPTPQGRRLTRNIVTLRDPDSEVQLRCHDALKSVDSFSFCCLVYVSQFSCQSQLFDSKSNWYYCSWFLHSFYRSMHWHALSISAVSTTRLGTIVGKMHVYSWCETGQCKCISLAYHNVLEVVFLYLYDSVSISMYLTLRFILMMNCMQVLNDSECMCLACICKYHLNVYGQSICMFVSEIQHRTNQYNLYKHIQTYTKRYIKTPTVTQITMLSKLPGALRSARILNTVRNIQDTNRYIKDT